MIRFKEDQFSEPYDEPILVGVKHRFIKECGAIDVPILQRLSAHHLTVEGNALRRFHD